MHPLPISYIEHLKSFYSFFYRIINQTLVNLLTFLLPAVLRLCNKNNKNNEIYL